MTERDPMFYWRQNNVKTCTKCLGEIGQSEKFIKITINGVVSYRHDRKCA